MAKIQIKQVVSRINRPAHQRRTLDALGLHKLGHVVVKDDTPQIRGMIKVVMHLVEVKEA